MTEAILPRKTVSKHLFRSDLTLVSALIAFFADRNYHPRCRLWPSSRNRSPATPGPIAPSTYPVLWGRRFSKLCKQEEAESMTKPARMMALRLRSRTQTKWCRT